MLDLVALAEAMKAPADRARVKAEWKTTLADRARRAELLAAIEHPSALQAEIDPHLRVLLQDACGALAEHPPAVLALLALWNGKNETLGVYAGHALLALGRYDELAAALEGATGTRLNLALRALFTRDPARAFDQLALTPGDSDLLDTTLYVLFRDITDDGKRHWGKTRGWFAADPRWRALCEALNRPPSGGARAQRIFEIAAQLRNSR